MKLRVFHGMVNYGTQAGIISKTLREEFGIKALSVVYGDKYQRQIDVMLSNKGKYSILRIINSLWILIRKIYWFFRYNTFHFYYGTTLFSGQRDLPLYKIFNKKVIMHYLGNDVEQYQWSVENYEITNMSSMMTAEQGKIHDLKIKKRLRNETKYIDCQIVCAPQYAPFVPTAHVIPLAVDLRRFKYEPLPKRNNKEPLIILHAATSRKKKGTEFLISAVAKLQNEGYEIELDLCEGITHAELMERYKKCHISVVALLGGWYGTAAIESMAIGRPVISFIRDSFFKYASLDEQDLPIINANRESIYEVLKQVYEYEYVELEKLSSDSYDYVHKVHDPKLITFQILNIYKKIWNVK